MPEDEKAVLEEALENLREAAQRIRAVSNRMRAAGMREDPNHHDLMLRAAPASALTEAAGMEARRKLGFSNRAQWEDVKHKTIFDVTFALYDPRPIYSRRGRDGGLCLNYS